MWVIVLCEKFYLSGCSLIRKATVTFHLNCVAWLISEIAHLCDVCVYYFWGFQDYWIILFAFSEACFSSTIAALADSQLLLVSISVISICSNRSDSQDETVLINCSRGLCTAAVVTGVSVDYSVDGSSCSIDFWSTGVSFFSLRALGRTSPRTIIVIEMTWPNA